MVNKMHCHQSRHKENEESAWVHEKLVYFDVDSSHYFKYTDKNELVEQLKNALREAEGLVQVDG